MELRGDKSSLTQIANVTKRKKTMLELSGVGVEPQIFAQPLSRTV